MDGMSAPYQVDLLKKAVLNNVIVAIEDKKSKSFIASNLIKEYGQILQGGMTAIYLVAKADLIDDVADALACHSALTVGRFYGDRADSAEISEGAQIIVCTANRFRKEMVSSRIRLDTVALLVLDDCLHALNTSHPYWDIINQYSNHKGSRPRFVGLTTSLTHREVDNKTLDEIMLRLRQLINGSIEADADLISVRKFRAKPKEYVMSYRHVDVSYEKIEKSLSEALQCCNSSVRVRSRRKMISKGLQRTLSALVHLGPWSACRVLQSLERQLKRSSKLQPVQPTDLENDDLLTLSGSMNTASLMLQRKVQSVQSYDTLMPLLPPKIRRLLKVLQFLKQKQHNRAIVIVEDRRVADMMNIFISSINEWSQGEFGDMRIDFVSQNWTGVGHCDGVITLVPPVNFRSYISQRRIATKDFVLLVEEHENDTIAESMKAFYDLERILLSHSTASVHADDEEHQTRTRRARITGSAVVAAESPFTPPTIGQTYLYVLSRIDDVVRSEQRFHYPPEKNSFLGFISSTDLPKVPRFSVHLEHGEVTVDIWHCGQVSLNAKTLSAAETFHQNMFKDVKDRKLTYTLRGSPIGSLVVPVKTQLRLDQTLPIFDFKRKVDKRMSQPLTRILYRANSLLIANRLRELISTEAFDYDKAEKQEQDWPKPSRTCKALKIDDVESFASTNSRNQDLASSCEMNPLDYVDNRSRHSPATEDESVNLLECIGNRLVHNEHRTASLEDYFDLNSSHILSPEEPMTNAIAVNSDPSIRSISITQTGVNPYMDTANIPSEIEVASAEHASKAEQDDYRLGVSPCVLLQALSPHEAGGSSNFERYKHIGKAFMKLVVTEYLFHERRARSQQLSTTEVSKLGKRKNLEAILASTKLEAGGCCDLALIQSQISDKSISQSIQALIGAHVWHLGQHAALRFMEWIGFQMLKYGSASTEPLFRSIDCPGQELSDYYHRFQLSNVETAIGYTFRNKGYLLQAFSHESYYWNRVTESYERLEFLGDAVLDYMVSIYLCQLQSSFSSSLLPELHSALTNNIHFASLSVKYKFHKHLLILDPSVHCMIERFVILCRKNRLSHVNLYTELFMGTDEEIENEDDDEEIEVPKTLGDIFESVAGAVFLDCEKNLNTVSKVLWNLMKDTVQECIRNPPRSPLTKLLQLEPEKTSISNPVQIPKTGKVRVTVEVDKLKFAGVGRTIWIAKCTAAKRALRHLRRMNPEKQCETG